MAQETLFKTEYRKKFISLDLETTHLDMEEGCIMEIGAVEAELYFDGKAGEIKCKFGKKFDMVVNPEIEPSEAALAITGIARAEIAAAPVWAGIKQKLSDFLGQQVLVGHNISFDLGFLKNQGLNLKNSSIDTLEITQTLLPLATSHSLEILGESLGVLEGVSHRAFEDCQNTVRVLCAVLNEFLKYPEALKGGILELLNIGAISFSDLLSDLPKGHSKTPSQSPPIRLRTGGERGPMIPSFRKLSDKTIIKLPISFRRQHELLQSLCAKKEALIIAVPHPVWLENLPENQQISNPAWTLCQTRLEMLRSQGQIPVLWRKIFAKILIGREFRPAPLDLLRLRWTWEERELLYALCTEAGVCLEHNCEYAKSLAAGLTVPRFMSLDALFDLVASWNVNLSKVSVAMFGLSAIEENFTGGRSRVYNLRTVRSWLGTIYPLGPNKFALATSRDIPPEVEKIANELDLFFGILHLIYLKREGEYASSQVVDADEIENERFQKLLNPAEKLADKLREFGEYLEARIAMEDKLIAAELRNLKKKLLGFSKFVQEFFLARAADNLYWFKFGDSRVDLCALPKALSAEWHRFQKEFKSVSIVDAGTPQISLPYFRSRLGLNDFQLEEWSREEREEKIKVTIFETPVSKDRQIEFFKTLTGRTLVIVPNETALSEYFTTLMKQPVPGVEVFAHKYSGSAHSLRTKTLRPSFILLLTTNALLKYWQTLPQLDNLAIVRLPFEPKSSKPSLLGLPAREEFSDHVLPRTIQILHQILTRFLAGGSKNQQIIIFDHRIGRDYDGAFMEYLGEYPNFVISTAYNS